MENLESLFGKQNNIYDQLFSRFGDSAASVGIPKDNQHLRYGSISNFLPRGECFSFLDYGSGLGHMLEHFDRKGFEKVSYTGVDINEKFIAFSRSKYTRGEFFTRDELISTPQTFDYVGVVGTFNISSGDLKEYARYVESEILALWQMTRKALFLNFMSTEVDFVQNEAYHQDLGLLYGFIVRNMSRSVIVDSSYLPYEFTLAAMKS